jgi:breast cancer 2 susceptibility protein
MVLCITSIISSGQQTNGETSVSGSYLELTDGWYRIRANVDPPLQRAIDAGRLRTGYKMAIAGARVILLRYH